MLLRTAAFARTRRLVARGRCVGAGRACTELVRAAVPCAVTCAACEWIFDAGDDFDNDDDADIGIG